MSVVIENASDADICQNKVIQVSFIPKDNPTSTNKFIFLYSQKLRAENFSKSTGTLFKQSNLEI